METDINVYREYVLKMMKDRPIGPGNLALEMGLTYLTLRKFIDGKDDMSGKTLRTIKEFVAQHKEKHGVN